MFRLVIGNEAKSEKKKKKQRIMSKDDVISKITTNNKNPASITTLKTMVILWNPQWLVIKIKGQQTCK